jgi:hypothetical protein
MNHDSLAPCEAWAWAHDPTRFPSLLLFSSPFSLSPHYFCPFTSSSLLDSAIPTTIRTATHPTPQIRHVYSAVQQPLDQGIIPSPLTPPSSFFSSSPSSFSSSYSSSFSSCCRCSSCGSPLSHEYTLGDASILDALVDLSLTLTQHGKIKLTKSHRIQTFYKFQTVNYPSFV